MQGLRLFKPSSLTPRLMLNSFHGGEIVVLLCEKGEGKQEIKRTMHIFSSAFPKQNLNNLTYVEGKVGNLETYQNCKELLEKGKLRLCNANGEFI